MQDTDAVLNKGTAMLIDETTLIDFGPRGGRKNLQGEDLTPPEMALTFSTEMDRVEGKLNTLGHLYKRTGAVRLWLEFVENMPLGLKVAGDERPRVTDPLGTFPKNGAARANVDELADVDATAPTDDALVSSGPRKRAKR
jgi:hypothetical protein